MKQDFVLMPECQECGDDLEFEYRVEHEDIIIKIKPCRGCIQSELDEAYDDGYDKGSSDAQDEYYDKGYEAGYEAGFAAGDANANE